jgi:hypothetical protein
MLRAIEIAYEAFAPAALRDLLGSWDVSCFDLARRKQEKRRPLPDRRSLFLFCLS